MARGAQTYHGQARLQSLLQTYHDVCAHPLVLSHPRNKLPGAGKKL